MEPLLRAPEVVSDLDSVFVENFYIFQNWYCLISPEKIQRSYLLGLFVVPRCFTVQDMEKKDNDQELPESLQLHQLVVRKIGEICRIVNQVTITMLHKLQSTTI